MRKEPSYAQALSGMLIADLLREFREVARQRGVEIEVPVRNRLHRKLAAITSEMKRRKPDARPTLRRLLDDSSESVRLSAAAKLMPIATNEAVPVLEKLMDAERPDVVTSADITLWLWRKGDLVIDGEPVPPPADANHDA